MVPNVREHCESVSQFHQGRINLLLVFEHMPVFLEKKLRQGTLHRFEHFARRIDLPLHTRKDLCWEAELPPPWEPHAKPPRLPECHRVQHQRGGQILTDMAA